MTREDAISALVKGLVAESGSTNIPVTLSVSDWSVVQATLRLALELLIPEGSTSDTLRGISANLRGQIVSGWAQTAAEKFPAPETVQ